jgi:hypothetical protein
VSQKRRQWIGQRGILRKCLISFGSLLIPRWMFCQHRNHRSIMLCKRKYRWLRYQNLCKAPRYHRPWGSSYSNLTSPRTPFR